MRILFADKFQLPYVEQLKAAGHDCDLRPELGADDLPGQIASTEILVVRSTKVTSETIAAGDSLAMIIRAGAGTNTIDKDAAARNNIPVCNVPGKNALAVAELAFGLLLCIDRDIPNAVIDLRAGRWDKNRYSQARGIYGRNLGIVGLGEIGMALAERAAVFGMRVHVISKPEHDASTVERLQAIDAIALSDLDTLVARCDVVSFHVPSNAQTKRMINADLLAKFQDGAILLNTARGEILDERALLDAIETKGIRAGLDVYDGEPVSGQATFASVLAQHPSVYGTPHVGASTEQAQNAVAEECVRMIEARAQGQVLHCVNL